MTRKRVLHLLRWLAFVLCAALFVVPLSKADLSAGWERIRSVGPIMALVLVPFFFAMACDAAAWRKLLAALGDRVRLSPLLKVRLAIESVVNVTPAGMVWAEAISPILVARRTGARVPDVVAASTAKRWLIVRAHATYVFLAAGLGYDALSRASRALVGSDALVLAVVGGALGMLLLSLGIEAIVARGQIAGRVSGFLGGTRFRGVQQWIEGQHHHFTHADAQIARLSADRPATTRAMGWIMLLWVLEGFETYLILHLLGAPLGLVEVMSFDAALSVVRSTAVFAPAGIGVQDIGYLAVLEAYGVPSETGIAAAFIVIKRMKEVVWIAIGLVILARTGGTRRFHHGRGAQGVAQPPSAAT